VERITYVNEENAYTVARFKLPRQKRIATIAGVLPGIAPGEGLRIEGHWTDHPTYGRQFLVASFESAAPGTVPALKRYLGSGLLRGVGPVVAEHIVNTFGLDTIRVLDDEPDRLREVPGMGAKRAQSIATTWRDRRLLQGLMVSLQGEGLSMPLAVRILKKYGSAADAVVRENPYRLPAEIYGVTFALADSIARRHGIAVDHHQRLGAGIVHTLRLAAEQGNTFLPLDTLVTSAAELLSLPPDTVQLIMIDQDTQLYMRRTCLPPNVGWQRQFSGSRRRGEVDSPNSPVPTGSKPGLTLTGVRRLASPKHSAVRFALCWSNV
jgi:exodeoxyribonuclease V alpha subunit